MNLEDLLGKIETDGDNAHVDGPPVCGDTTPTTLWHSDAEGQRSSTPSKQSGQRPAAGPPVGQGAHRPVPSLQQEACHAVVRAGIIVDLSEEEEALVLATLDPLSELAEVDTEALQRLLQEVSVDDVTLMELLTEIGADAGIAALDDLASDDSSPAAGDSAAQDGKPPEDFPSYGEDIPTQFCCPKCGYRWSGKPDAGGADGSGLAEGGADGGNQ
ncbi:hypothetical protein [Azospirillum argentinense]